MVIDARQFLIVRLVYLVIAAVYAVVTCMFRRSDRKAVVLCYHAVTDKQRDRFRWQMQAIQGRARAVDDLEAGRGGVYVTFDDAFACLIDNALPITRQLGIPVTIFAVPGNLGSAPRWRMPCGHPESKLPTMSADEMRVLSGDPLCRFGSHTASHAALGVLSVSEAEREMIESKSALGVLLNKPVDYLALPYGSYNEAVAAKGIRIYRRVFTLDATCHPSAMKPGLVGRFQVSPDMWPVEFRLTAAGAFNWLCPFRQLIRSVVSVIVRRRNETAEHVESPVH